MRADIIVAIGRLRRPPVPQTEVDAFVSRMSILNGLIEMRKAGIFRMIYCDNNQLAVVLPSPNDIAGSIRQRISWLEALQMVEEFKKQAGEDARGHVERKPAGRAIEPGKAKKWA